MNDSYHQLELLDAFGPARAGAFDFTLFFEDSFFTIAPASIFLIAAVLRTIFLYRGPAKVHSTAIRSIKSIANFAFVGFNLSLLILWAVNPSTASKTSIAAATLDFAAAVSLAVLSPYEHSRNVAPSTLVSLYLIVTVPLDVARVRTLFLLDHVFTTTKSIAGLSATVAGIKAVILVLEAINKRHILLNRYRHLPTETTSGPYGRTFFWWLNPLLLTGYKNFFEVDDLYDLDDSMSSTRVGAAFQAEWISKSEHPHKHSLVLASLSALRWHIASSIVPRALLIGLTFAQPFLIRKTITYVSNRADQPGNIGWGLVGAYAIVYTGMALLTALSQYLIERVTLRLRGGLVSLIYQKTLDLSITALDEGAALTLMSTDVERITQSLIYLNESWAAIIQVAVSLYLLYTTLGVGFVAPLVCFLCALIAMVIVTKLFPRYQGVWVEGVQARVSSTSAMLGSMRSIKLLGLSSIVGTLVQDLRVRENLLARKFRYLELAQVLAQNVTSILAPVATFAVYVIQANSAGRSLDAATAYSILSILQLVGPALLELIRTLPALVASLGCFTRIQTFLMLASRQDHRSSLLQSSEDSLGNQIQEGIALQHMGRANAGDSTDILVLKECSFGWTIDKPLVHNIDLKARRGSLCMIIGPTGCGKSTMIKGLLGETPCSTGFVYMDTDSVAFADQSPWTINGTIKACICGEDPIDGSFYHEVVNSCGLREDIDALSKGDETVIGSKGIALSGGQRARLALARAVFARKKLLILDDVFSGIDADTEEHIFRNLFRRDSLLRRSNTTILLVTHAVARLSYADWVVALDKDGGIAEQGTYEELKQNGSYVTSLDVRFKENEHGQIEPPATTKEHMKSSSVVEDDDATNDLARKTGDWDTYKHYFAAAGWRQTILLFILCFVYIGSIKSPALIVKFFTGPDKTTKSNDDFMIILGVIASVSFVSLGSLVALQSLNMIPRASNGLHQSLLTTVLNAPLSFFTKTDTGTTLNRFSQDLNVIDTHLSGTLIASVLQLALFLIGGALMVSTAVYTLAIVPVIVLVLFAVQRFYLRTSRQLRHLDLEQKAPLYTHFEETLSGLPSIRAFRWVDQFRFKNAELLDKSQRPVYLLACVQCWLGLVLDLLVAALAFILMIIIVSLRHKIDPSLVGLGLLNVMAFNESMTLLITLWTMTETSIGAIARVRDFVKNTEKENKTVEDVMPPPDWPSQGVIEFKDFSASYSESSEVVVRGIHLTIRPGEKIGICGRSGSGKSSLLASLFHLLEYREGSLLIDGLDVASIPRDVLRGRMNALPQEAYWVTTQTVRSNLYPWNTSACPDDEESIATLKKCQIWEAIREKGGLDVKMDADFLSHGQRQLFCLARSLLRKSKIVVLDEVSASVDIHTDATIQAVIREEFKDCAIIAVAHRLNTIVDFDKVVVLDGGRIVEEGVPGELLVKEAGGRFRALWEL